MIPRKLTFAKLESMTGFDRNTLWALARGRRQVSDRLAFALGLALGTSAEFWLKLQFASELALLKKNGHIKAANKAPPVPGSAIAKRSTRW